MLFVYRPMCCSSFACTTAPKPCMALSLNMPMKRIEPADHGCGRSEGVGHVQVGCRATSRTSRAGPHEQDLTSRTSFPCSCMHYLSAVSCPVRCVCRPPIYQCVHPAGCTSWCRIRAAHPFGLSALCKWDTLRWRLRGPVPFPGVQAQWERCHHSAGWGQLAGAASKWQTHTAPGALAGARAVARDAWLCLHHNQLAAFSLEGFKTPLGGRVFRYRGLLLLRHCAT